MAGINIELAARLSKLPPYLFAAIDEMKQEAINQGKDVINLGVGDPDRPTPKHIIDRLAETAYDQMNHQYPSYTGMVDFRKSMADYYSRTRNVELDPVTEALTLIGSKEGVGHLPMAFVDPGDIVLCPDPGYPVYSAGTVLAGGEPYFMPLEQKNSFLPDLGAIPDDIAKRAKLMFINYPNNPTAATCDISFFDEVIAYARKHNIIVVHDAAYADVTFDNYRAPSFLEAEGAKEVGIELYSLSKTYNMTGWRIACALGNPDVLKGLGKIKTNLDSGQFQAVQYAAIAALESSQECVKENNAVFQERRDILVEGLRDIGWEVTPTKGTFYVWIKNPGTLNSTETTAKLIKETAVVTTPGVGFGAHGEGYIRMTLTTEKERLTEAVSRLSKLSF